VSSFADLGLSADIQRTLGELGYEEPTPIQEQAIPELLAGNDVDRAGPDRNRQDAAFGLPCFSTSTPPARSCRRWC